MPPSTRRYDNVDWDLPDAVIAARLGVTREAVRSYRRYNKLPKPAMRLPSVKRGMAVMLFRNYEATRFLTFDDE